MKDYEKLGTFYLGNEYDLASRRRKDNIVLYDSKDLNTHAVIIGMTGSGKTGLGIALIEEALIDKIPVIAIDPKGDLPNILLNFPELRAEDFRPWINEQDALYQGETPDAYAEHEAKKWLEGLAEWDQEPDRIARLKASADFSIYTPGSSAGLPVSILRNFAPPQPAILNDTDLLRERIQTTATSMLTLIGLETDPISSPEHILLANILESTWSSGRSLDLPGLIQAIQSPPFRRLGVLDLDLFFPPEKRFSLAMRLNNLLAAPGFEAWLSGESMDISRLLFTDQGKPKASIFTINHLSDSERMFFVSMLLNEILGWMRTQPGTSSLRAILYMDEILGYFPPIKNPPSKAPLLTLLKQARAFGLGIVLSTQNPVDLDYKGLSNAGTWFIGRLQTEQDKERVLGGLEGAAAGTAFDRGQMAEILASLGKRVFLLHNVHENEPTIFQTRWVLSYLRGPMTRDQIKTLTADRIDRKTPASLMAQADSLPFRGVAAQSLRPDTVAAQASEPPVLPPGIDVYYLTASGAGHGLTYYPAVTGRVEVHYTSAKYQVDFKRTIAIAAEFEEGPLMLDWDNSIEFDPSGLEIAPLKGADYVELPVAAKKVSSYRKWSKNLLQWVRLNRSLTLYRSERFNLTSYLNETEREFRSRLAHIAREGRDLEIQKLRRKYRSKFTTLNNRLMRAEQSIAREREQAKSRRMETAISFGTAILGAFLGRKTISATSASRIGTAMKTASRSSRDRMDVARAQEVADATRQQLSELERQLHSDIQGLEESYDPETVELEEISVKAKSTEISLEIFGLAWIPYRKDAGGRLTPDWRLVPSDFK